MDEHQQDTTPNNTDETIIPPTSTTEYVDESTTDNPKSDTSQSNNKEKNKELIQVIVNKPKDENRAESTANKIAIFGLLINLILAIFTYLLFQKTVEANKTSQSALKESSRANDISALALADSRKADSISEIKDSISYNLSKSQYEASREKDSISMLLAKQSINAQINSLKETQNQFTLENLAYIECTDFTFVTFESNKEPKIAFRISNVGKVPVKITKFKLGFFYKSTIGYNPDGYLATIIYDPYPTSFYVTKESPRIQNFTGFDKIPTAQYDAIKKEELGMFFCGEIQYTNEINNKKMKYIFNAFLYPPPSKEYRIVYLNNSEIK